MLFCTLTLARSSAYVFLYSVYYFFMKTKMSGFFQTTFYFTCARPTSRACASCSPINRAPAHLSPASARRYMGVFCLALGLMCGTLGYSGCGIFVRRIYRNIKSD
jgi:transmembrane 9 superfamily protein 3